VTWRAGRGEVGTQRITAVFSRIDCGACIARPPCTLAGTPRARTRVTCFAILAQTALRLPANGQRALAHCCDEPP
jgi:hypothetical protein